MVSVIIDSCTYGNIIKDSKYGEKVVEKIIKDKTFNVCNFRVIRNELKKAPKQVLEIYDWIVSKKTIIASKKIVDLAEEYYKVYKRNKGGQGKSKILNDFMIVACASIKSCDLVFSDDGKTLKSKNSLKAYKDVNLKEGYRTPTFYSYKDLKKKYC